MSLIVFKGDFVYGEFVEAYNFETALSYIKQSAGLCIQNKCHQALMDLRGVTGKITTWDQFRLAQASLSNFGRILQLAIVYREDEVDGFFEDVIVNRGGNFRIFTDLVSACRWLGIEVNAVVVK
jgi:hypothetical protein